MRRKAEKGRTLLGIVAREFFDARKGMERRGGAPSRMTEDGQWRTDGDEFGLQPLVFQSFPFSPGTPGKGASEG